MFFLCFACKHNFTQNLQFSIFTHLHTKFRRQFISAHHFRYIVLLHATKVCLFKRYMYFEYLLLLLILNPAAL
jgi:hypothetical protein